MGRNAKLKEKQKWSNEKLHLENARKLRQIKLFQKAVRKVLFTKKKTHLWCFCSAVWLKNGGGLHGMLLPSAKYSG